MRVNEPPVRQHSLELHAQPAHVDVDRAITRPHLSSPREAKQLLTLHYAVRPPRELYQHTELLDRERQRPARHPRDVVRGENFERADGKRLDR